MEEVTCTYCGSADADILFEAGDTWYEVPGTFTMRRCRRCGLIYLSPRPSPAEIGAYYPDQYAPYSTGHHNRSLLARMSDRYGLRKQARLVQSRVPRVGTVLDVGCAGGQFLSVMVEDGWEAKGVETNREAALYARSQYQLDVLHGALEDAQFAAETFDLVTMWHVLEHVHEPRETLREVARITRPDGWLFVAVPNPQSLEARLFGHSWAGWDVPRHLHLFQHDLLAALLQEAGWHVEETVYGFGRHWLFTLSLQHWLAHRNTNRRVQSAVLRIARSLPMRILTLPIFVMLERLGISSIMGLFARKSESPRAARGQQ